MNKKKCNKCGKIKPDLEFYKNPNAPDGLAYHCRDCHREYADKWKEENKKKYEEWRKEYNKERYWENKEEILEQKREWRKENIEHCKEYDKKYREEHRGFYREYYRKYGKEWRKSPQVKIDSSIGTLVWRSLRDNKAGRHWEELVGYTVDELKEHLENQFEDWMNWDNYGVAGKDKKTWQIDHIKPRSSFDYNSVDDPEFRECWGLENLQPLDSIENMKKGDRVIK